MFSLPESNQERKLLEGLSGLVLEVGCYDNIKPAKELLEISPKIKLLIPIDKYQGLKAYREKLNNLEKKKRGKIYPLRAGVERLPFKKSSIEGIVFHYSTTWIEEFGGSLKQIYQKLVEVLKARGKIITIEQSVERAYRQKNKLTELGFNVTRNKRVVQAIKK